MPPRLLTIGVLASPSASQVWLRIDPELSTTSTTGSIRWIASDGRVGDLRGDVGRGHDERDGRDDGADDRRVDGVGGHLGGGCGVSV